MADIALAVRIMEAMLRAGAEQAEVFYEESRVRRLGLEQGALKERSVYTTRGVGIRVVADGRVGFACGSDLRPATVERLGADLLSAMSCLPPGAEEVGLPLPSCEWPPAVQEDPELLALGDAEQLALAHDLTAKARAASPVVTGVSRTLVQSALRRFALASSTGVRCTSSRTTCTAGVGALAEGSGDRSLYYATGSFRRMADVRAARLATRAGVTAAALLDGRPIPTGVYDVLFAPEAMAKLLQAIAPAFSGEAAGQGRSFLTGRPGTAIGSPAVTVVEDPTQPSAFGHAPFDHEGTATRRLELVRAGVLSGFAHHAASARRAGAEPTGNGWRGSYRNTPVVGYSNLYLEPGDRSPEGLMRDLATGVYLLDVTPRGALQLASGVLSFKAAGLWLERGEPVRAVRGITISCTLPELLGRIRCVGNDLRGHGTYASPSALFSGLTIGGQD